MINQRLPRTGLGEDTHHALAAYFSRLPFGLRTAPVSPTLPAPDTSISDNPRETRVVMPVGVFRVPKETEAESQARTLV